MVGKNLILLPYTEPGGYVRRRLSSTPHQNEGYLLRLTLLFRRRKSLSSPPTVTPGHGSWPWRHSDAKDRRIMVQGRETEESLKPFSMDYERFFNEKTNSINVMWDTKHWLSGLVVDQVFLFLVTLVSGRFRIALQLKIWTYKTEQSIYEILVLTDTLWTRSLFSFEVNRLRSKQPCTRCHIKTYTVCCSTQLTNTSNLVGKQNRGTVVSMLNLVWHLRITRKHRPGPTQNICVYLSWVDEY